MIRMLFLNLVLILAWVFNFGVFLAFSLVIYFSIRTVEPWTLGFFLPLAPSVGIGSYIISEKLIRVLKDLNSWEG